MFLWTFGIRRTAAPGCPAGQSPLPLSVTKSGQAALARAAEGGCSYAGLFVAQGFDGVKAGGADGRHHPADEANGGKNENGND